VPLFVEDSPFNTMSPGPRPTSIPSGIPIHLAVWPQYTWAEKWGLLCPFGGSCPSNAVYTCAGPRPTSVPNGILIHPAVWPQQTWAENGGCAPFWEARSASNTVWLGPRPIYIPSGILIHPTVWPQYTNVSEGHDRQLVQTTVQ